MINKREKTYFERNNFEKISEVDDVFRFDEEEYSIEVIKVNNDNYIVRFKEYLRYGESNTQFYIVDTFDEVIHFIDVSKDGEI